MGRRYRTIYLDNEGINVKSRFSVFALLAALSNPLVANLSAEPDEMGHAAQPFSPVLSVPPQNLDSIPDPPSDGLPPTGSLAGTDMSYFIPSAASATFSVPRSPKGFSATSSISNPRDTSWSNRLSPDVPGANNEIDAMTSLGDKLVFAGEFSVAGSVQANRVGAWDSSGWSTMGTGFSDRVLALTLHEGRVYAAGEFWYGTAPADTFNHVAVWDGSSWEPVGSGTNGNVTALASYHGKLYAAGTFTKAGGVVVSNLASWDGTQWLPERSGLAEQIDLVFAFEVFEDKLCVAGRFMTGDGVTGYGVATWDGSTWSKLGVGMNSYLLALAVYDGQLCAGGVFTSADSLPAKSVARWDGVSWTALGSDSTSPVDPNVRALTVHDGKLYAGGYPSNVGGNPTSQVASWDGTAWSSTFDMNHQIVALHSHGGRLFACGWFRQAGGHTAQYLAAWDGVSWSTLGTGFGHSSFGTPYLSAATTFQDNLYVAGQFTTVGGVEANRIAKWDGSSWSTLSTGLDIEAFALAEYDGRLVVGGYFAKAGGITAKGAAAWDGTRFWALGSGTNNLIYALTVYDGKLIAGGYFTRAGTHAVNYIAAWNGTSWEALGTGVNSYVLSLAVYDGKLIVGGDFNMAGGVPSVGAAAWDGTTWSALSTGDRVYALTVWNGTLYAGGNGLKFWDGTSWRYPAPFLPRPSIASMSVYRDMLYVGGIFTYLDTVLANNIAGWTGYGWTALGSGVDNQVRAMTVYDDELVATGFLGKAGGMITPCLATWHRSSCAAPALTGDLDASGTLGTPDILGLIGYVFKGGDAPTPCEATGDIDCSGYLDMKDVIVLVSHVFKGGRPPCNVCNIIPEVWSCP